MNRRTFATLLACGLSGCVADGVDSAAGDGADTTTSASPSTASRATRTASPTPSPTATETESPTGTSLRETSVTIGDVRAKRKQYDLKEVSYEERPQFILKRRKPPRCAYNADEVDEIPDHKTATIHGEEGRMPIRTSRVIMRLLYCYRDIGRSPYLDRAEEIADAYLDGATMVDGVPYFPYTMPKGGSGANLEPPWYSGMSQGTSLSAFLRLYETTGKEEYMDVADGIYAGFKRLRRTTGDDPWVAMVDDGYYWIEEYPYDPPTHVLNGFNVGLWGLYEYWLFAQTDESEALVQAAITTAENYVDDYRVPGEVSWYGLDHGYRGNDYYHAVHIHQLEELHKITGEQYFEKMAETFDEDHPESAGIEH